MARRDVLHLLWLTLLTNDYVRYSSCTYYGRQYETHLLESEKFCHPLDKKSTIDINDMAAVVLPRHMFDRWTVNQDKHCRFVFKTTKGDGLFAVIQKMSFRKKNESECLDYVKFKRKDDHWTEKFCGSLDRIKTKYYPVPEPEDTKSPARTFAEYDPIGHGSRAELETEIFISKTKLEEGQSLALSIVYTPYKNCTNVDSNKYTSINLNTCLQSEFFCDGIYNCVPGICSDEEKCPNNLNEFTSTGTGTKVTVGAVTTMILCFIIFVMGLWMCKRSQKLCWSSDCANVTILLEDTTRPGQLPQTERTANPPVPTAPMLEVAVPSTVADKDLPPSYDSLFPDQSNPVGS